MAIKTKNKVNVLKKIIENINHQTKNTIFSEIFNIFQSPRKESRKDFKLKIKNK
jgi:hypothetical protein